MKKKIIVIALATLSLGLGGCATVVNGTNQDVKFQSDPEGAVIELITGGTCETPCEYSMKRGHDSRVSFSLDGYKSEFVYLQSRLGGGAFGNILLGGPIGAVVDGSNGASNNIYPRPVYIRLVPVGSDEAAVLLDKKGEVISTVSEHNDKVREDVEKGLQKQGIIPNGEVSGNFSIWNNTLFLQSFFNIFPNFVIMFGNCADNLTLFIQQHSGFV